MFSESASASTAMGLMEPAQMAAASSPARRVETERDPRIAGTDRCHSNLTSETVVRPRTRPDVVVWMYRNLRNLVKNGVLHIRSNRYVDRVRQRLVSVCGMCPVAESPVEFARPEWQAKARQGWDSPDEANELVVSKERPLAGQCFRVRKAENSNQNSAVSEKCQVVRDGEAAPDSDWTPDRNVPASTAIAAPEDFPRIREH